MVGACSHAADPSGGRRGGRTAKVIGLRLILQTAVMAVLFSVSGHAEEWLRHAKGGLEAKLEYCKTCHGLSGQGYLGYFPMPRLAGTAARIHRGSAAGLHRAQADQSDHVQRRACAEPVDDHGAGNAFQRPQSQTARRSAKGIDRDRETNLRGRSSRNPTFPLAPPVTARRARAKMKFRDWRARSTPYMVGQLTGWKTERGQGSAVDTSAIMAPTAHNLTRSQIEAVAAYVSYLQ